MSEVSGVKCTRLRTLIVEVPIVSTVWVCCSYTHALDMTICCIASNSHCLADSGVIPG